MKTNSRIIIFTLIFAGIMSALLLKTLSYAGTEQTSGFFDLDETENKQLRTILSNIENNTRINRKNLGFISKPESSRKFDDDILDYFSEECVLTTNPNNAYYFIPTKTKNELNSLLDNCSASGLTCTACFPSKCSGNTLTIYEGYEHGKTFTPDNYNLRTETCAHGCDSNTVHVDINGNGINDGPRETFARCNPAPVDCVGSWSSWSTCPADCSGNQSRTYTITQIAQNGGSECSYTNGYTETRSCTASETPNADKRCFNNDVYYYGSCGTRGNRLENCHSTTPNCYDPDGAGGTEATCVECTHGNQCPDEYCYLNECVACTPIYDCQHNLSRSLVRCEYGASAKDNRCVACPDGYRNCLRGAPDGNSTCETNINNNPNHCGGCGIECAGSESCINGTCYAPAPVCPEESTFLGIENLYWPETSANTLIPDGCSIYPNEGDWRGTVSRTCQADGTWADPVGRCCVPATNPADFENNKRCNGSSKNLGTGLSEQECLNRCQKDMLTDGLGKTGFYCCEINSFNQCRIFSQSVSLSHDLPNQNNYKAVRGCIPGQCQGTTPANSEACPEAYLNISGQTNKTLVETCGSSPCQFTCASGYDYSDGHCCPTGETWDSAHSQCVSCNTWLNDGGQCCPSNRPLVTSCDTGKQICMPCAKPGEVWDGRCSITGPISHIKGCTYIVD